MCGRMKCLFYCRRDWTQNGYEKVICADSLHKLLGTTVAYLVDGEENALSSEIMQMVVLLQVMKNEEIRKVAAEQVKLLASLNIWKMSLRKQSCLDITEAGQILKKDYIFSSKC